MKKISLLFVFSLVLLIIPVINSDAAFSPELSSKKIVIQENENVVLKVKKYNKKVIWSTKSKNISLKMGKNSVKIRALSAGKAVVSAKVGKKILNCIVKISKTPFDKRSPKLCIYSTQFKSVEWRKVEGAEGYIIYGKNKSGKYNFLKKIKGGSKTWVMDNSNKKRENDFYRVKAYRKINGEIVYSKAATQKYILE